MRIVLDTNVLVSGLLNPAGPPGRILDLILDGRIQVLYDDRILGEYQEVLARPELPVDPDQAQAILSYLRLSGERATALPLPETALPDADDLPFAELAITAKAEALVSGNRRHFEGLQALQGILVSPQEFLIGFTT